MNTTESRLEPPLRDPGSQGDDRPPDARLRAWGGAVGIGGVLMLLGSVIVVVSLGLPDASDVETLRDFDDIRSGRIAEHLFYLGALVSFALQIVVLQRLLDTVDRAASLFGAVVGSFGFAILAASSMLHVSTAALSDRYADPGASASDRAAIEHSWAGAQSVFDTMLVTGLLLVPVGIVLIGVAMWRASWCGPWLARTSIGLGVLGFAGALAEAIDTSNDLSAISVLAMTVFAVTVGWRMLHPGAHSPKADNGRRDRDAADSPA